MSAKHTKQSRPHVRKVEPTPRQAPRQALRNTPRQRLFDGYRVDGTKEGLHVSLPGGEEVLLTRRHFVYGLAAVAAAGVVGGTSYVLDQMRIAEASERVLSVPTTSVFTLEQCALVEASDAPVKMQHELRLPYGTQVWSSTDNTATCLVPTDSSRPLTQIGVITLANGAFTTVLPSALGTPDGYEIYDARGCDTGIVWAESNILKGDWRIYQAPLLFASGNPQDGSAPALGEAHLCAEGSGDWEMPSLAAAAGFAFWQELPRLNTAASQENSLLKRVPFGATDAENWEMVYASEGRMACAPTTTSTGIVVAPRANTDLVNYQLTYIDAASAEVTDTLILPASMRPMEVAYGRTGFSFAFDGIYDYGGGIANLGTYVSTAPVDGDLVDPVQAAAYYGASEWFRFPRTPVCAPAWCGDFFMVKSTSAVCGVNLQTREYFALDVHDGATDYGDYLASTGMGNRIVTYSNIDYTPINGDPEQYSLVRIWGV